MQQLLMAKPNAPEITRYKWNNKYSNYYIQAPPPTRIEDNDV